MSRSLKIDTKHLLDREASLIAELVNYFREIVVLATEPITSTASAGQAAYRSMALNVQTQILVKYVEELLQLTRLIRELWIVGPLRMPGEGEQEAEATIDQEAEQVTSLMNRLRDEAREKMVKEFGGFGAYETLPAEDVPPQVPQLR